MTLSDLKERAEKALAERLPPEDLKHSQLCAAMRYSVLNGGKRLRPLLVYATGLGLGIELDALDNSACAVEYIHCYSLIHDDLPAMDNDDLRRGKPTCHIAFDEATAILAGDALQCYALEILSRPNSHLNTEQLIQMLQTLTKACGTEGMVAGQAIDVAQAKLNLEELNQMHLLKTGALIKASINLAQIAANNTDSNLDEFAKQIGLGFQIQDDILDIESSTEILGKPQNSDAKFDKTTYPELLGLDGAKTAAADCLNLAIKHLDNTGENFDLLKTLASQMIHRSF